jgi:hypothetical protein
VLVLLPAASTRSTELIAMQRREALPFLAANLRGFEELQTGVCTRCCLSVSKSDLNKAYTDLSGMLAPIARSL